MKLQNSTLPFNNQAANLACLILFFLAITSCRKDFTEKLSSAQGGQSSRLTQTTPPNIILFIADDFGYELPTFTGGNSYSTPNLDLMAANGITFSNAYSHPDGYPSRLALYTGKYNFRNYTEWGKLPVTEKTIGNMLQDAGYKTCFVGKWQCGGGDARIHSAGYDKYLVFMPYAQDAQDELKYEYKNPRVYAYGMYMPASATKGKYSEDLYTDYLNAFIDSNKTRPFFAVYAHNLPRTPWAPTPDDPDFAGYNPDTITSTCGDQKYFAGMVNYLDKKIGQVIQKLQADGLADRTIILFCGDNATNKLIKSTYQGSGFWGGKNLTSRRGIQTPLIAFGPGLAMIGKKDSTSLVDYTDFLPTLAGIAGITVPSNYGILDGVTFYDNIRGVTGPERSWSFCHWDNDTDPNTKPPRRYAFDLNYKLYDTSYGGSGKFYDIKKDPDEKNPIGDTSLKSSEKIEKNKLTAVLSQMHN